MNFLILLYLLAMGPKLFWDRIAKGKRHPGFLQRLGLQLPTPGKKKLIWIHAVSVGEVKAAQPLFNELRKQDVYLFITTTSATGQEEAKRSLPQADAYSYLPIDFSFVVRRFVKKLNPHLFILVESDFWYNLLKALKKNRTRVVLVSGKMSQRSSSRFAKFPFFAKKLFSLFDEICVQNETYRSRFLPFVLSPKLHITGNLKLDIEPRIIDQSIPFTQPVITISCTHHPEEELLLDALISGPWTILLAPRHPERFDEVAQLLERKKIPFSRWSQGDYRGKVVLIDAMGQLPICYKHSRLSIVAGSYIERIGGHNVLEPCLYGSPVIFGPYTHGQTEFANRAIESEAGMRLTLDQLRKNIELFFADPQKEQKMREAAHQLIKQSRGAAVQTLKIIGKVDAESGRRKDSPNRHLNREDRSESPR